MQMLLLLHFLYSDFCWPCMQKYAPKLYIDSCFCNEWMWMESLSCTLTSQRTYSLA
jgi:hypothetical protein